ncbi:MAG TPA: baseplate J/gp47 family protein [Gaiellaceae bacterium]|nr:baseplate J/gp47 family protein [Gaiellaceae bacterium]
MSNAFADALTARDPETIREQMLSDAATEGADVAGFDAMSITTAQFSLDARAQSMAEQLRVVLVKAGLPHLAKDSGSDWVDQVCFGFYQEKRIPALPAVWSWTVTCSAHAGPYTLAPESRELVAVADDGTLFENTNPEAVVIPSGGSAPVQFTCRTPGIVGNQLAGAVTRFVAKKPGLRITNVGGTSVTGGRDAESDDQYIARCFGKWAVLGAGYTRAAFNYLIPLYAPTVTRWFVRDDNPFGPGTVGVWLANAAGPASDGEVAAVLAGLTARDRQPLGTSTVRVLKATAHVIMVVGTIFNDGTNAAILGDAVDALGLLSSQWDLGQTMPVELVTGVLMGGRFDAFKVPGFTGATDVDLTSPIADTDLLPFEVLQFNVAGLVTSP